MARRGVNLFVDPAYPARFYENDGDVHRTDARTWRRDVAKRQWLEDLGWRTVVATADDVYRHPARLVARVAALLRSRAVPGPAEK